MKKHIIAGFVLLFLAVGAWQREAIADVLSLRFLFNGSSNATSTPPTLRYVTSGATTTYCGSVDVCDSQTGFSTADLESITLAYQVVSTSSAYSVAFEVEYGYDVPNNASKNRDGNLVQWFKRTVEAPTVGNIALASSTQRQGDVVLSTTTPRIWRYKLNTGTTSEVVNIPTYNAKYMRILAIPFGSAANFWLNVVNRDYKH